MPSLRNYAVQIDFDLGRLTLFDEHASHDDWGQSVPLMLISLGTPVGPALRVWHRAAIHDRHGEPYHAHRSRPLMAIEESQRRGGWPAAADMELCWATAEAAKYRLTNLSVADFEHDDLLVNEGEDNVIGLDYLSRYRVTLDFPHWRMYLTKGPLYDRNSDPGRSGLTLRCDNGRIMVDAVEPNSAACEADLKVGDELIRINGDDPRTMSLFEIRRLLGSPDGCEIPVEVSRPHETICTVLAITRERQGNP